MRGTRSACLCSLLLFAWPAESARGQGPARKVMTEAARRATELTERAYDLQKRGSLNDAIKLYEEALRIDPLPKRHRNLAIPLQQAGRLVEALICYFAFQRDELGERKEHRRDVAERVASVIEQLGHVAVREVRLSEVAARVRVREAEEERPRCVIESARPLLDVAGRPAFDAPRAPADEAVYLCEPGEVHAELLFDGSVMATAPVAVKAGEMARVRFSPKRPVRITVNRPRAEIFIDQVPLQGTPPHSLSLLLGRHRVRAQDGRDVIERTFDVRHGHGDDDDHEEIIAVDLRFARSRRWIYWLASGVALGIAAATAGVIGYVATRPAPPGGPDVFLLPPM